MIVPCYKAIQFFFKVVCCVYFGPTKFFIILSLYNAKKIISYISIIIIMVNLCK